MELGICHKHKELARAHLPYKQTFPDCCLHLVKKSHYLLKKSQNFDKSICQKRPLQARFSFPANIGNKTASAYLYFLVLYPLAALVPVYPESKRTR